MATDISTRERIAALLEDLPAESLPEIVSFLEYQQHKFADRRTEADGPAQAEANAAPLLLPTPMGGLARGYHTTEEDIAEARRDMWGKEG